MQVRVKVRPNAKHALFEKLPDGSLSVHLKSPPVDSKANDELLSVLSEHYGVPKSRIRIKRGAGSRNKLVEIDGL
jgi:uncharacterized protein